MPSGGRTALLHIVYDGIMLLVLVLGLPYFLFRLATSRRFRKGLRQRLGFVPRREGRSPCLWIHGVSVGEIKAARPVALAVKERFPEIEVVFSSTTPTGFRQAGELYPGHAIFYYPLDLSLAVTRVFRRIRPSWIVLMELEIWPNLLRKAHREGVPVAVVNGRISERSHRGYRKLRSFLPQFSRIQHYCVQNTTYRDRFLDLGVEPDRLSVTGNIKFDNLRVDEDPRADEELAGLFAIRPGDEVLVGGSTHQGEELSLYRVVREFARRGREVRLILAPRHPERVGEVVGQLRELGAEPVRLTDLRRSGSRAPRGQAIVVDTIGELERVYTLASAVFVGGSLASVGGHNVLEPAALGRAVLFGPHTFNFDAETELLLTKDAAIRVEDEEGLCSELESLLEAPEIARAMGLRAAQAIAENQGATLRTIEALESRFIRSLGSGERVGCGEGP